MAFWTLIFICVVVGALAYGISSLVHRPVMDEWHPEDDEPVPETRGGMVSRPVHGVNEPEEVKTMGMQKFGQGEILPEDKDVQKTAKEHWTAEDSKDLKEENEK